MWAEFGCRLALPWWPAPYPRIMGSEVHDDDMSEIYLPDGRLNPEYIRGAPPSDEDLEELMRRKRERDADE